MADTGRHARVDQQTLLCAASRLVSHGTGPVIDHTDQVEEVGVSLASVDLSSFEAPALHFPNVASKGHNAVISSLFWYQICICICQIRREVDTLLIQDDAQRLH